MVLVLVQGKGFNGGNSFSGQGTRRAGVVWCGVM